MGATSASRHFLIASLVLVLLGVGLAFAMPRPGPIGIEARLAAGLPLRVGYAIEPPYAYLDSQDRLQGESLTVLAAVLDRLGVDRVQHLRFDFAALPGELEAGRIDLIAGGLFITPERAQRLRFSRPSAAVRPALLLRSGLEAEAPLRLAVIEGAVEAQQPQAFWKGPVELQLLPDARTAVAALSLGQADALALSAPSLRWMQQRWSSPAGFELRLPELPANGYPAFALAPHESAFAMRIDRALADYLGSEEHRQAVEGFGVLATDIEPVLDWQGAQ
jgi:polar amino acid transport system substrate-binding protein